MEFLRKKLSLSSLIPQSSKLFVSLSLSSFFIFRRFPFATPGSSIAQVIVGDFAFLTLAYHLFSLLYIQILHFLVGFLKFASNLFDCWFNFYGKIIDIQIALNAVQRQHTKVFVGDEYLLSHSFSLVLLTLELEYVKAKANRNEEMRALDVVVLAHFLHKKFSNQGYAIIKHMRFYFLLLYKLKQLWNAGYDNWIKGTKYIFTANQVWVEEQETSNAIERAIITNDTYTVFEAALSSGIKI
ncbi:hypothetical protein IEQ34_003810 [Dendrobium chrysotoxum]|uniref:Uncharacterized protein n=1 Tax=Dendrobium chrysotoxum TaxID=161865 RepID=A0AAV7HCG9_DENCH|nr:hypothetical protein IEQ34_003810 [Dendrobium chrysotoxum]